MTREAGVGLGVGTAAAEVEEEETWLAGAEPPPVAGEEVDAEPAEVWLLCTDCDCFFVCCPGLVEVRAAGVGVGLA